MNLIDYTVSRIKLAVPTEILQEAFKPDITWQRKDTINIDWLIRTEVIENVVAMDLNVLGGEQVRIIIDNLTPEVIEGAYVYTVPLSMTQNRYISRVISLGWASTGTSAPTRAGQIIDASMRFESESTAQCRMLAPNVIAVHEALRGALVLKCILSYDDAFSTINQAYWRDFATLATIAAEMIIHQRLSIRMASGSYNAGAPNSAFIDRLNEMADARTRYDELLSTKWTKLPLMADHESRMDVISYTLGGYS